MRQLASRSGGGTAQFLLTLSELAPISESWFHPWMPKPSQAASIPGLVIFKSLMGSNLLPSYPYRTCFRTSEI